MGKCWDEILNEATTISFQIISNLTLHNEAISRMYTNVSLEEQELGNLQTNAGILLENS
jgi:hypothetical protein